MKISVLYGTETGNAEMLADDLQTALSPDHDVHVLNLAEVDPSRLSNEAFHVIVCSTYGDGDLPASARPFAEKLAAGTYDLSEVRFAMFGLGDAEYTATFNHGSLRLAELLQARGARQIGERLVHNASGHDVAEEIAVPWLTEIIAEAGRDAAG